MNRPGQPQKRVESVSTWATNPDYFIPISQQNYNQHQSLGYQSNIVLPHSNEVGTYLTGDVYTPLQQKRPWEINTDNMPYLQYIKNISHTWPSIAYLASWMEVTTSPVKWKYLSEADREIRAKHTRVAMIDFPSDGYSEPSLKIITCIEELRRLFSDQSFSHNPDNSRFFIIEDLSRDVIETFGSAYDIDPTFWRGHISDYLWYNTRDPWVEIQEPAHIHRDRNFFHFRYVHPRYFKSRESQFRATQEARAMNVLRRLDDDRISATMLDDEQASINMWRNKASLWYRRNTPEQKHALGILIVDPSLKDGFPLWGKSYNLGSPPSFTSRHAPEAAIPKDSLFQAVIHWTMNMSIQQIKAIEDQPRNFAVTILNLIASEWQVVKEYIATRLTQIEWELEVPDFRRKGARHGLDASLKWLHPFRRNVPRYRAWVTNVLKGVLNDQNLTISDPHDRFLLDLREDFDAILTDLETLRAQVQDLVRVVTAIIAIEEAKRTAEQNERTADQNRSLTRLTYLAVVFVPLSFVSSFFSMTSDLSSLHTTFWIYFVVAVPLTLFAISVTRWWNIVRWAKQTQNSDGR